MPQYWTNVVSKLSLTHLRQISAYYDYGGYRVRLFHVAEFKEAAMTALLERTIGLES